MINNQNRPRLGLPADVAPRRAEERTVRALQNQAELATALLRSVVDRPRSSNAWERRAFAASHSDVSRSVSSTVDSAQRLLASSNLSPRASGEVARALAMLHKASSDEVSRHGAHASVLPRAVRHGLAEAANYFFKRASGARTAATENHSEGSSWQHISTADEANRAQLRADHDSMATLDHGSPGGFAPLTRQQGAKGGRGLEPKGASKAGDTTLQKMAAKLGKVGRKLVGRSQREIPLVTPFVMEAPTQVKTKRAYEEYAHLPFASRSSDQRFSRLTAKEGHSYVMTWTQVRGGFGKVRWGFTSKGEAVAIKEIRHTPKPGYSKEGRPKTHPVLREQAIEEAKNTVAYRQKINGFLKFWDDLPATEPGSLKHVRRGTKLFELHDVIVDDTNTNAKSYLVMTKWTGDLLDLRDQLRGADAGAASLSLAVQGFRELAGMHDGVKALHGDLKLENILFNETGQMALMDFGMSQPLDKTGHGKLTGIFGSITVPEAIAFGQGNVNRTKAAAPLDVYAMGVMVAEMAQRPRSGITNPFVHGFRLPGFKHEDASASFKVMYSKFESWRAAYTGRNGRIDVRRIDGNKNNLFDRYFADLARTNPALCDVILNDAMATNVANRLPARALAQRIGGLTAARVPDLSRLVQEMDKIDKQGDTKTFRDNALAYDAFDKAATAAGQTRPAGKKPFRELRI